MTSALTRTPPLMTPRAWTAWLSVLAWTASACSFDAGMPAKALIACAGGEDCPEDRVCLVESGLCISPSTGCVRAEGRFGVPVEDGTACADGICVAGGCVAARCGDGVLTAPEQCDDGNEDDGDVCTTACAVARCGDGSVQAGVESCDDGNTASGDGCRADCAKVERCGDAIVDEGEPCDDGNENPTDGCDRCREVGWSEAVVLGGHRSLADDLPLHRPHALAMDGDGRLFFCGEDAVVRRLDPDGTMTTVAGTGRSGFGGDGGPATAALLGTCVGLAVDLDGRLLIADRANRRIRRVDVNGTIDTVLEGITPNGVGAGPARQIVVSATTDILRINADGTTRRITGGSGDHGAMAAGSAIYVAYPFTVELFPYDGAITVGFNINAPHTRAIALDPAQRIYLSAEDTHSIVRFEANRTGRTVLGGPGGACRPERVPITAVPAASVAFCSANGLAVNAAGEIFVADTDGSRILRIRTDGTVDTVVAHATIADGRGEVPAITASLVDARGVAFGASGDLRIADRARHRIYSVDAGGTFHVLAGTGLAGALGDGGPATAAQLDAPVALAAGDDDALFVLEAAGRIRRIAADGTITTFPLDAAIVAGGVASAGGGALFVADPAAHRVLEVDDAGTVTVVAGTGAAGFSGDGGPATAAELDDPRALARDASGTLFIADGARIRVIGLDGRIETFAGTGVPGFSGDGGPARQADIGVPAGLAPTARGLLFSDDTGRVRLVGTDGVIDTVAGSGSAPIDGPAGDGGPARAARLASPRQLAVDAAGQIFVASGAQVRQVDGAGTITSVAGAIDPPGAGPLDAAAVFEVTALERVDASTLLVAAGTFGRVLATAEEDQRLVVAAGYEPGLLPAGGSARHTPLRDVGGLAFDGVDVVYVSDRALRRVVALTLVDPHDASSWTARPLVESGLGGPAGLAFDAGARRLLIADEGDHCVRSLDVDSGALDVVAGVCGVLGFRGEEGPALDALFFSPRDVEVFPGGRVYIADTGNRRVRLVEPDGSVATVLGDGSASSSGVGSPARFLPTDSPQALALDPTGNLFVAAGAAVRVVANIDGDESADGDDTALTIYRAAAVAGATDEGACLSALAIVDDGTLELADSCRGAVVELRRGSL